MRPANGFVPLAQVLEHGLDLAGDEGDVCDETLDRRLAEAQGARLPTSARARSVYEAMSVCC